MRKGKRRGIGWLGLAAVALLLGAGASRAEAAPSEEEISCIKCHGMLPGRLGAPVKMFKNDIHAEKGFSCVNCHGGDPTSMDLTKAKSKAKGFIGAPKPRQIPELCDKCHGDFSFMRRFNPRMEVDQLSTYWTSIHGQRLAQGDVKVATCASCHGAHGILPASRAGSSVYPPNVAKTCGRCHADRAYMKDHKIPTDQFKDYLQSVHAELLLVKRDLSAPTCNDCHGNHGAFPPAVTSVAGMCGQCHVNNQTFFEKSPHKKAFDALNLPECVVCHSNHEVVRVSVEMIGGESPAVCVRCHAKGTKGHQGAVAMRAQIDGLESLIEKAHTQLEAAERLGMEVSEAKFRMKDTQTALLTSRTKIHYFSPPEVEKEVAKGKKVAQGALEEALAAIAEFHARRRWVILPVLLSVLLAGLLYMKLRQVEGKDRKNS